LSDSQRSELPNRYLAGEPATALANELGVTRATIFSVLRRAGVPRATGHFNDADVAIAQQQYEAGHSLATIGEHFGVSDRTVLNAFHRAGTRTRAPGTNQWSQTPQNPR
jgi:DNA-directed RNA polymerase specialized sigma24 family protein